MSAPVEAFAGAYVALFVVMLLAWAGLPIAGQAALLAAGVLAGDGDLRIEWVLVSATLGSIAGGALGYWIGFRSGSELHSDRGPLRAMRQNELARGAKLVKRHVPLAVLFAPTWIAGVYHVTWRTFLPWNVIAAVTWTLVTALGGYWIGPGMARALGVANAAVLAAGVILVGAAGIYLWRRSDARHDRPPPNGPRDPDV
jgi:membrane protein DedA with SNARE-associated domain